MTSINLFNAAWYLDQNPDVAAAVAAGKTTAAAHFSQYGLSEGRAPGPLFDQGFYLNSNPDVKAAVEAGHTTAYAHFLSFGAAENRSPLVVFDSTFYLSHNADVAQAVLAGQTSAVTHFLLYGQDEPRSITPFINLQSYLEANADVQAAVVAGSTTVFEHLASFGLYEGRDLGNGLNLSLFQGDAIYEAALAAGDADAALARLYAVAPFLPGFVRPEGWQPSQDTPIPLDFKPADGSKLHVPEDIKVPDGMALPDWFDNVAPQPAPAPSFSVKTTEDSGTTTYTFEGTADGDITGTLSLDAATIGFSRGGVEAEDKVALTPGWTPGQAFISLSQDQTLLLASNVVNTLSLVAEASGGNQYSAITGNGIVSVTGSVSDGKFIVSSAYSLIGVDSSVQLVFEDNAMGFTVGDTSSPASYLQINARHADGREIGGAGFVRVVASEAAGGTEGVTLVVRTMGTATVQAPQLTNYVGGTAQNDTIEASPVEAGKGTYHIMAGLGADSLVLNKDFNLAVSNLVEVRTGKNGGASDSFYSADLTTHDSISNFYDTNSMLKLDTGTSIVADVGNTTIGSVSFAIQHGMATFTDGSISLDDKLVALAGHLGTQEVAVGFIDNDNTYIFQGDGTAGVQQSDVFLALIGTQLGMLTNVLSGPI